MFKNLILIGWRNVLKHRFHTGLNVFGLSLGISCAMVLFRFIHFHLGFDTYHQNASNLYRVVTDLHLDDGSVENERGAPVALGDVLAREVPQIRNKAALLRNHVLTVSVPGSKTPERDNIFAEHENTGFADKHWFELFDYRWLEGNAATALEAPNTVVITAGLAKKYFGRTDPIGKTLLLNGKQPVSVTGILADLPSDTDFKTELFISLSSFRNIDPDNDLKMRTDWFWINSTTSLFVQLSKEISPEFIRDALIGLAARNMGKDSKYFDFHLQSLRDVHFDGRYSGTISRSLLTTLAFVAFFLILIACINFINLATAQQVKRSREIGTRKVLGSGPATIFWQFMTETGILVLLSAIGSVLLLAVFFHRADNWLQLDLGSSFFHDKTLLLCFLLLLAAIAVMAGFYPAFILSRVKPIAALKNTAGGNAGSVRPGWKRKALIIVQNGCAQTLIVCALIITTQLKFVRDADLGFNQDAIVMVPIPDNAAGKLTALRNELFAKATVADVSFCYRAPSADQSSGGTIRYDDRDWEKFVVRSVMGDAHYTKTFGLQLLAGRNLQESDTVREFLINEELVHKLGYRDPQRVLGHRLVTGDLAGDHPGIIVGVIRNFYYNSLYTGIEPVQISTIRAAYRFAAIKMNGLPHGGNDGLAEIGRIWKSVYPENSFEYQFVDEEIGNFYRSESLLNRLVGAAAAIAIAISCLGLLGLVSLLSLQRTKEIGIRKVVGASEAAILVLLSKDFMRWILLSVLIAAPFSYWVMHQWLGHFAYRVSIPAWIFLMSGIGGMGIAVLTIAFHSLKAARANPVKALRSE